MAIVTLSGDNGILTKASSGKIKNEQAIVKEQIILAYGEYQVEIQTSNNTKLASINDSLKRVAGGLTKPEQPATKVKKKTFIEYLEKDKQVINSDGIVDVKKLTGNKMTLGNGTSGKSDVYIISLNEEGSNYVLNYYDVKENKTFLWEVKAEKPVKINISKSPETEKSVVVFLNVASVEGPFGIHMSVTNEEEENKAKEQLLTQLSQMLEEEKKELAKQLDILMFNEFKNANLSNFEDLLKYLSKQNFISEATEKAYWEKKGGIPADDDIIYMIIDIFRNEETRKVSTYEITNPAGEISNSYVAEENGTYTFTVKDLLTGNTYKKSVEVTNVDKSMPQYYVNNFNFIDMDSAKLNQIVETKIASVNEIKIADLQSYAWCIGLRDVKGQYTDFSEAYIIYDEEKLDITAYIKSDWNDDKFKFIDGNNVQDYLQENITDLPSDFAHKEYQFILVKDGIEYKGTGKIDFVR